MVVKMGLTENMRLEHRLAGEQGSVGRELRQEGQAETLHARSLGGRNGSRRPV
jgi:hypothetical protein